MDSIVDPPDDLIATEPCLPPWGPYGRDFTLGLVSLWSKFVLKVWNSTEVENKEDFLKQTMHRDEGQGLITVANHTSTLDDPMIFSAIMPWSYFLTEHTHGGMRWSLCAKEICFKNELLRQFFLNGKVLPIERGEGIDQPIMQTVAARVRRGDWVHVFPEGQVNYTGSLGPLKWGIGKLVCDAVKGGKSQPTILPFYHSGMGSVMPKHAMLPRPGNKIFVVSGDPIDVSDLTPRCNSACEDQRKVWKDITERVEEALRALEARAPPNVRQDRRKQRDGSGTPGTALPE